MILKSLLVSALLVTSLLAETTSTNSDASNITVSESDVTHLEHKRTITFKTPVGTHGVTSFVISVLPSIIKGNGILTIETDAALSKMANAETANDFIPTLYHSLPNSRVVMSSLTADPAEGKAPWPSTIDMRVRQEFPLETFAKDLPTFLSAIKEHFGLDDESLKEISTFITHHAEQRKQKNEEDLKEYQGS
jgi:hypothetical protein